MRGVAFALLASGVLALGALGTAPASATCYGDCEYLDAVSTGPDDSSDYTSSVIEDDSSYEPVYRSSYAGHDDGYYRRPYYRSHRWSHYDRPYYRGYRSYRWGYHHRPRDYGYRYGGYYRHHHYRYGYYGYRHRPLLLGGGWSQTAWGGGGLWGGGGCQVAYIPYGWRWFRGTTC